MGDEKVMSWNLDNSNIKKLIFPINRLELFLRIIEFYRDQEKPEANIIVFKAVEIMDAVLPLHQNNSAQSDFHFISIIRDCRAVFASQRRTIYKSRHINRNPLITSYQWAYQIKKAFDLSNKDLLEIIKYEDLITETEYCFQELLDKLGLSCEITMESETGDLFNRLPAAQKKIHTGINQKPDYTNIDKWKSELPDVTVSIIQKATGKLYQDTKYDLLDIPVNKAEYLIHKIIYKILILLKISRY